MKTDVRIEQRDSGHIPTGVGKAELGWYVSRVQQQTDWPVGIQVLVKLQVVLDLLRCFRVHGRLCWGTGSVADWGRGLDESIGTQALLVLFLEKLIF